MRSNMCLDVVARLEELYFPACVPGPAAPFLVWAAAMCQRRSREAAALGRAAATQEAGRRRALAG